VKTRKELLDEIEALVNISDRLLRDAREIGERSVVLKRKMAVRDERAKKKPERSTTTTKN
jgi:hypothetical protein